MSIQVLFIYNTMHNITYNKAQIKQNNKQTDVLVSSKLEYMFHIYQKCITSSWLYYHLQSKKIIALSHWGVTQTVSDFQE